MSGISYQSFLGVFIVLGIVAGLAWLARRGAFKTLGRANRPITVETAVALGERRSLVIVAVEGRRLLLGLTPGQISMVTELASPKLRSSDGGGFEARLDAAKA